MPFISSWGWGTWARAWKNFDASATGHEQVLSSRKLRKRFDLKGPYTFSRMLQQYLARQNDSWAIRWYLSVFRHEGSLFPRASQREPSAASQRSLSATTCRWMMCSPVSLFHLSFPTLFHHVFVTGFHRA